MSDRRVAAFDPTNERAVIGRVLLEPESVPPLVTAKLSTRLFFDPVAKTALVAIGELQCKGVVPDLPAVTAHLRQTDRLESIGGAAALTALVDPLHCAALSNLDYCVEQLCDQAARRLFISTQEWTQAASVHGATAADLVAGLEARAAELRELAGERRSFLPAIQDAVALISEHAARPPEVICGVLHQGSKAVVGGGSKSFKTWILLDAALSVATGQPWLGFETRRGRVLYINLEIQSTFFADRLRSIRDARALKLEAGQLCVWTLRGHAADLSTLVPEIVRQAEAEDFSLIVVDPIYKVLGGRDENAAGDIGGLLNEIERLAVKTRAAVLFGAHFSKGNQAGKEAIDRIGGSGVFARDPDAILTLTRHEEDEAFTLDCTLRNHAPVKPFVVRWQFPLMQQDNSLDPAKLKQVAGRPKTHNSDELYDLLAGCKMTFSQWLNAAKEHAGMSKGTFVKLRGELIESGRVHQSKIDQTYEQVRKVNK